jgi:hypothetical protein
MPPFGTWLAEIGLGRYDQVFAASHEGNGDSLGGGDPTSAGRRNLRYEFQKHSRTGVGLRLCLGLGEGYKARTTINLPSRLHRDRACGRPLGRLGQFRI